MEHPAEEKHHEEIGTIDPILENGYYVLRVSGSSNAKNLATTISQALFDSRKLKLRAIGAGAVNQAYKACAVARGYVAPRGVDLLVRPGFDTVTIDDKEISAVTFLIVAQ
jgi:stage V sporulation protein S